MPKRDDVAWRSDRFWESFLSIYGGFLTIFSDMQPHAELISRQNKCTGPQKLDTPSVHLFGVVLGIILVDFWWIWVNFQPYAATYIS